MIVVHKLYGDTSGADPVLAYDAEEEQLWGYPRLWRANVDKVGLSEEEFSQFFDGPRLIASETDSDPFEDTPNAEELLENYPPGSEEIPDVPTPRPPEQYDDERDRGDDSDEDDD